MNRATEIRLRICRGALLVHAPLLQQVKCHLAKASCSRRDRYLRQFLLTDPVIVQFEVGRCSHRHPSCLDERPLEPMVPLLADATLPELAARAVERWDQAAIGSKLAWI